MATDIPSEHSPERSETLYRCAVVYRPDIDGLRAVAVLLVMLYHAGIGFHGGFLGVDVFFVISGYLITGLILRDVRDGAFSLRAFWGRRIRRILPASTMLLLSVLAAGYCILLPADLVELSDSVSAHSLFSANMFFWAKTGYFDGSVELKPLLHFWSLAVEEQFYVLYPFYLIWLPPLNAKAKKVFLGVFLMALVAGFYGHARHPSAAFYLLPCRAWELLLGGGLCLFPNPVSGGLRLRNILGLTGLALIVICSLVPHQSWSRWFPPGLFACAGTALVILAGDNGKSVVTRLLSFGPFVGVGLISYSLYLWHWPLLAFLKHLEADLLLPLGNWQYRLICLVGSFILAIVSYYSIEKPIRSRRWPSSDFKCFALAACCCTLCLLSGAIIRFFHGVPGRFDARVVRYAQASGANDPRFVRSMSASEVVSGDLYACGPRDADRRWILLGDSHAMNLLPAFETLASNSRVRIDQATRFATAPLKGFDHLAIWRNDGAEAFVNAAMQVVETTPYECVILFAAWEAYVPWPGFKEALYESVRTITASGKRVVFVLPVPDQGVNVPIALAAAVRWGQDPAMLGIRSEVRADRMGPLHNALIFCGNFPMATVDPVLGLSDETGLIRAELDGEALYSDNQHLSPAGSRRVAEVLFPQIIRMLSSGAQSFPPSEE